jgi:hypothetical protein
MPSLPAFLVADSTRTAILNGTVTAKEQLKAAIDALSEDEAAAARIVIDPVPVFDDEPWTEADDTAIAEVHADRVAGVRPVPLDEIKRKYGPDGPNYVCGSANGVS